LFCSRTDDLLDQWRQIHRLRAEFELAGLDLGEVEHLIDEAEKMGTRTVNPAQRLCRLFRAKARRIADHHLGQPDDGIERGAQLMAHAGDELRLVLACHFELTALFLHLGEQIGVLDGQHGLRREGLQQIDAVLGKLARRFSPHHQHTDEAFRTEQRHDQHCSVSGPQQDV
jgi:hypothetical protein